MMDYTIFCAQDDSYRDDLNKPIHAGKWLAHTDGRIAVFLEGGKGQTNETSEALEKFAIAASSAECSTRIELPALRSEDKQAIENWRNFEETWIECDLCNGTGEVTYEFAGRGHYAEMDGECPKCHGAGGFGETRPDRPMIPVSLLGELYDYIYLEMILELPNVRLGEGGGLMLAFNFEGGCGLLMPMRDRFGPRNYYKAKEL